MAMTREKVNKLLQDGDITYDLLWALFTPNSEIFTRCLGNEQPRCVRVNHGAYRDDWMKGKFFKVECRYHDFNGSAFGEAKVELKIDEFRGIKPISQLEAFPLQFHDDPAKIRTRLIECGRTFVSLIGNQYREYSGIAFDKDEKDEIRKVQVDGRIMLDAAAFKRMNPNYKRSKLESQMFIDGIIVWTEESSLAINPTDPFCLREDDLLVCHVTIPGFSLRGKRWRKTSPFRRFAGH
jgi:hypothetical protein